MATNSKDFKIKNGLIVQGATATVNGNDVITSASSISDLSDIDTSGATDLQALVYNAATSSWIPGEAVGGGSGSYTISATAPVAPEAGDVWFDSTDGKSYIYYDDGDTQQWLEIGSRQPGPTGATGATGPQGDPGRFFTSDTAPSNPVDGDVWFNSSTGVILVYYTDADSSQWVESGYPVLGYQTLSGLTDTAISSLQDGEALVYDSASSKWVNQVIDTNPYNKSTTETGFLAIPAGTEAERPVSPANGYIRFNTESGEPEWYSLDNDAWYNFRATPTFKLEYLVIAGGGGGASSQAPTGGPRGGGGGGAGGYRANIFGENSGGGASAESELLSASGTTYTITVGAGGAGGASNVSSGNNGSNGNDSVFYTITSLGGGYGGRQYTTGGTGGSGGGTGALGGGRASGTANQGFNGGAGASQGAGGGGGAGGNGADATDNVGGAGGVGVASLITGSSLTMAVGGRGGNYGSAPGSPGDANTGNGGEGGDARNVPDTSGAGGAGGSGIVILKYPSKYSLSASAGLSSVTNTVGDYKVTQFTAGTGTVTFS